MALCGSVQCGCALSVTSDLVLTGAGSAASPWLVGIASDPPALAKGRVGSAQITTTTAGTVSVADAGLSVAFTAEVGRRYLITVEAHMYSSVAADNVEISICNGSNVVLNAKNVYAPAINTQVTANLSYELSGVSGAYTAKVRYRRATGTGNAFVFASATSPAFILVEDIGT